ncbi:MAG: hypothetical protein A3I07_02755 [Candidatus Doudnabacteria bacterium RIFCSPLOWO2_02_FULL_42_9]|nr:MAG: hypothetical protein A3K07_02040 [Candidatus Doudnabacteria bacterium RIFCSPHIGHO2_01_43_10]OGE98260.1 MAG: hypothetical protein A3G89_00580 [Candidatus Doudnabacteria bacterium RIFCSPLOWO2_12_FULL_42_9]OGF00247.1 MAG: hypothetical protein A3I07_02755 [Candidatus Doudnabacteria bacterium RIFCSPLOWO2_02_FULL_42_9]
MTDTLLKQLKAGGLSEKEAKIYLALLELEVATVFEVAKTSGVNRSSAYVVLEGLKKKGLVGISDDQKVRKYIAASPDTLLHSAKSAAKKQEDIKSGIESIIPELRALHKATKRRPIVKVFEGENGAKEVYWQLFSSTDKILRTYANPINIFKRIPDFEIHDKERAKRGIKMFAINPASNETLKFLKDIRPHKPYEQALIPENKFRFTSDMGIFGDKIALVSPVDNFGIIIESKEIADMLKNSFDLAWEEAKRLDKIIRKKYKIPKD